MAAMTTPDQRVFCWRSALVKTRQHWRNENRQQQPERAATVHGA